VPVGDGFPTPTREAMAMKSSLLPVGVLLIGFLAVMGMKGKSHTVRILIGMPAMMVMMILLLVWAG
jgi:hypothetical protein